MPFDREKAREVLFSIEGVDEYNWSERLDPYLDALEGCVTPRLAEVDVRLVGEAEAKLARIRAVCDEMSDSMDPEVWPYARRLHTLLHAPL